MRRVCHCRESEQKLRLLGQEFVLEFLFSVPSCNKLCTCRLIWAFCTYFKSVQHLLIKDKKAIDCAFSLHDAARSSHLQLSEVPLFRVDKCHDHCFAGGELVCGDSVPSLR